jgi:hypothetical protein
VWARAAPARSSGKAAAQISSVRIEVEAGDIPRSAALLAPISPIGQAALPSRSSPSGHCAVGAGLCSVPAAASTCAPAQPTQPSRAASASRQHHRRTSPLSVFVPVTCTTKTPPVRRGDFVVGKPSAASSGLSSRGLGWQAGGSWCSQRFVQYFTLEL